MEKGKASELVCIRCPIGCRIAVEKNEEGILAVSGNSCKRGEEYARKELTNPTRTVTSTVRVKNGKHPCVSVKTKEDIPKEKIMECMKTLKKMEIEAPVHIGDVIIENVAATGVAVIATKNV